MDSVTDRGRRRAGALADLARRAGGALLAALLPADCLLCAAPLPWRQRGSVCLPCWSALPWRPGRRPGPGPAREVLWAADYDGPFRRLIHGLKFEGMDYLGRPLGEAAADRLAPLLSAAGIDLVVPVPLHIGRRFRRGFDQALLLAGGIAGRTGLPLRAGLLRRPGRGRRQLGLGRRERLRSLAGCYAVRGPGGLRRRGAAAHPALASRTVLLVDDVLTTGATLAAAARALRDAGAAAVVGCVIARTPVRPPGAGGVRG